MAGLIYRRVFEDWETLDECLAGRAPSLRAMRRRLFVLERDTDVARPDHYYKNYLDQRLGTASSHADFLLTAINDLADTYLEVRGGRVFAVRERFGDWQHLLPFISPLVVIAARIASAKGWSSEVADDHQARARVKAAGLVHTALPTVWDPLLDDLIRQEGLNEMHLHLNGSTELDLVWLEILRHPDAFFGEIRQVKNKEVVRELYEQIRPGLNEYKLYRYVRIARRLRAMLTRAAFPLLPDDPFSMSDLFEAVRLIQPADGAPPPWLEYGGAPFAHRCPDLTRDLSDLQAEAVWYIAIYRLLKSSPNPAHAAAFHAFLLILGMIGRLTIQQTDQFGFDQFQKFTLNGMRENAERVYLKRFNQLTGQNGRDLDHLEARCAPKKEKAKTIRLIQTILRGYAEYHLGESKGRARFGDLTRSEGEITSDKRMKLGLVFHFIKAQDQAVSGRKNRITPVRHHLLRRQIWSQGLQVLSILDRVPAIRDYISGVDAAANEQHASPEVFAPLFRMVRRGGIVHATYHVGEDFEHLLSGIRGVSEAVAFLDLQSGDRIGHGTAVGIDPRLWLRRIGPKMMLRLQDHLDNLVFACRLLGAAHLDVVRNLGSKIALLTQRLYGRHISPDMLFSAWEYRHLDPLLSRYVDRKLKFQKPNEIRREITTRWQGDSHRRIEAHKALDAYEAFPDAFNLFLEYHTPAVHQRGREWSEVSMDEIDADALIDLQHHVLGQLHERNIAIETLPTSNVRISFYNDHEEHHLRRWLGRNPDFPTNIPMPVICVGSDDPGIFATNLRNEYTHIQRVLCASGMQKNEATAVLQQLNANGRAFRFQPKNC